MKWNANENSWLWRWLFVWAGFSADWGNATKAEADGKIYVKTPFASTSVVELNSQWLYVRQSTRYNKHRKFRFPRPHSPEFMMRGAFQHESPTFFSLLGSFDANSINIRINVHLGKSYQSVQSIIPPADELNQGMAMSLNGGFVSEPSQRSREFVSLILIRFLWS